MKIKIKGFILDLRNNPGGLLSQAIGVVDLFVDKGIIVSQKVEMQKMKKNLKHQVQIQKTKLTFSGTCKWRFCICFWNC